MKKINCKKCGRLITSGQMISHVKACNKPKKTTYRDFELNSISGKYVCPTCKHEFQKWALKTHIWFKHGEGLNYKHKGHKHNEETKKKIGSYNKRNINNLTLLDLPKRTVSKIIKRAKLGCGLCGWNKAACDLHHIISKKKGGSNNNDNLILICPNCHRIVHTTNTYKEEHLQKFVISKTFKNWKDYYYGTNIGDVGER